MNAPATTDPGGAGDDVVAVRRLVKRFGRDVVAVDRLDLTIRRGEIYGLLGPNGAGKTTTLRVLLGLVRPSAGSVRVLGRAPGASAALARIGSMGETEFYPFLSGRDNLRAVARRCRVGDGRVEDALQLVSLTARAGDAFSGYSLGMKQRLSVAAAVLKDPELLILDEPSNGLDPVGRLEMRDLIYRLGSGGRTIVLSSHDMDEVERLCGRVGVIAGGRMLVQGTPAELRGDALLMVTVTPAEPALEVAMSIDAVEEAALAGDELQLRLGEPGPLAIASVVRELVEAGIMITRLETRRRSLDDAFLDLTGRRTAGADSLRSRRPAAGP